MPIGTSLLRERTTWLSWAALAAALAVAVLPLIPPQVPASAPEDSFSAKNALQLIAEIAVEPRPMGSDGNRRGREKIAEALRDLGLEPEFQSLSVPNYYTRAAEPVEIVNVLARIPGADSTGAIALMGHHDTFPTTPGANDNTSALAILLESARAILAGPPLRNDVILIFTDAEEPAPRYGSTALAEEHPWFEDIRFVINLEAIGRGGISVPVGISGSTRWIAGELARTAPYPTAFSVITTITDLIGGSNTDFSVFKDRGVPGMDVAFLTGSSIYHTPEDSIENVGVRSVYQQGANSLALTRRIGGLDLTDPRGKAQSTFFSLGRFVLVRYPNGLVLPLALLSGLVWAVAMWRDRRPLETLKGAGVAFASALLSAVLAALIWTFIAPCRDSMGIVEGYVYFALLSLMAFAVSWALAKWTRRQTSARSDGLGVLAVLVLLAIVTAAFAPGTSYVFAWPALVGAALLLCPAGRLSSRGWKLARLGLAGVVTLTVFVPVADFFFQFANPRPGNPGSQVFPLIAVSILLVALATELLRAFWPLVIDRMSGCR